MASDPSPPWPWSTRRWSRGPTTGSRNRTTRPRTPSSWPCARRPVGWAGRDWRTRRSSPRSSRARCASGRLLESDVEALVFAVPNEVDGAAGTVLQLAQHASLPRRIKVVSGIRRDEAAALFVGVAHRLRAASIAAVWYPLPRRGVRVVDGAALEKRCAKAPRVRIPPSPPQTVVSDRPMPALARLRVLAHAPSGALAPCSSPPWPRTADPDELGSALGLIALRGEVA